MRQNHKALLALEDGTTWPGYAFGAIGERTGEVVFNTAMTGYQEVLTDPSYYGQIVVMTAPHIGNTGVNTDDPESRKLWLSGFVVRAASPRVSNWRAQTSLDDYLREHGVVGITGVDTRALVLHIREAGAMRAVISSHEVDPNRLVEMARQAPSMEGLDLVHDVTCAEPYHWTDAVEPQWILDRNVVSSDTDRHAFHVVAYDYGIKHNILRLLASHGCRVTVVPATASASAVLELDPDGIFLSNGPGDPAAVTYGVEAVRDLLGKKPIFGICLGHQILGLALGGTTYKLRFGHHGANQPVRNADTTHVEISSHNHGFAVDADSLPKSVEITHLNLNDGCVEGLRVKDLRAFSVQYHPEAAPGPHDAAYLFEQFIELMKHMTPLGK
ncbi:MAG: carbamoyl-phosphate synthase small subunit [Chloroflexi bacterium AL-W]|nr:carbamoyl-phosphate synthase small subunit [Chloroflexi bacterium AL-N1]NOK67149.1 carbamoyl-phosphate synthase small subunit [Chloroflexi bacterium AL-N10]NOK74558.1 carbamoyl-phosphate synthase small subunit [Chloroflexi bacterium AL-N5]NOK81751.1 carbamoyl-phosphate synthase small subunit [Chloroflexi bacterium AL-W]NOK89221.1 carbamoyl-phosphate synthase small subunit [Chloroflexi bacterium AL-N15]